MYISSLTNAKVKDWMRLYQKKYRKDKYLLLDETLINEAHKTNHLDTLIYVGEAPFEFPNSYEVSLEVMHKLGQGAEYKYIGIGTKISPKEIEIKRAVLLDDLQDPQNVGMILHSAELFGIDTVVLSENTADIYHEKCLNASKGSIYHVNVLRTNIKEMINELHQDGFKVYATGLTKETKELEEVEVSEKLAFVLGNEGSGVRQEIYDISDEVVKIRMENIDSLNVAIAGTIVMYYFANKK